MRITWRSVLEALAALPMVVPLPAAQTMHPGILYYYYLVE